jgi:hypothetical protein
VTVPYLLLFLVLLAVYLIYSVWVRLDPRYPIVAALALLIVTAVLDAAGESASSNTFAEYVFILLAGGIVLLLLDHVRDSRPKPARATGLAPQVLTDDPPAQPTDERKRPADQALDRLQKEPVALVNATGRDRDQDEQPGERQP